MPSIEAAFNKYAVNGRLNQKGMEKFLREFDANPSGGLDINELRTLANQGLDFSRAAANWEIRKELNAGCRPAKVRKMDTQDIGARNFTRLAEAIYIDASRKLGQNGLALTLSLDQLKKFFAPNSATSLFDKYPLTYSNCRN